MCGLDEQILKEDLSSTLIALGKLRVRREAEVIKYKEFVDFTIKAGLVTEKDVLRMIAILIGMAVGTYFAMKWFMGMVLLCS